MKILVVTREGAMDKLSIAQLIRDLQKAGYEPVHAPMTMAGAPYSDLVIQPLPTSHIGWLHRIFGST